jgi:nanoRNase/pAp phosphatase (c-di-AMP/oligoRNAs hydrolase)
MQEDISAFILTILTIAIMYFGMSKSKHYSSDNLVFTVMYVSAPIFIMCKYFLNMSHDYLGNNTIYILGGIIALTGMYIYNNTDKKINKKKDK